MARMHCSRTKPIQHPTTWLRTGRPTTLGTRPLSGRDWPGAARPCRVIIGQDVCTQGCPVIDRLAATTPDRDLGCRLGNDHRAPCVEHQCLAIIVPMIDTSAWPRPTGGWPTWVLEAPYVAAAHSQQSPQRPIAEGANCQRYAYGVLALFGRTVPDHRSSELWDDPSFDHPR